MLYLLLTEIFKSAMIEVVKNKLTSFFFQQQPSPPIIIIEEEMENGNDNENEICKDENDIENDAFIKIELENAKN